MDLHWTLKVSVQYHSDLLLRLDVEVFADSIGSTLIFIVDYNSIDILRIFLCIYKVNNIKILSEKLNFKDSLKILLVVLPL